MADREASTFSIDKSIKKEFKLWCLKNGVEMSTALETLMKQYNIASKQLSDDKQS